jgi:hypothetical protein
MKEEILNSEILDRNEGKVIEDSQNFLSRSTRRPPVPLYSELNSKMQPRCIASCYRQNQT